MSKWSTVRQMMWKVTTTQSPFKVQGLPNTGPLWWIYPQRIQHRKKPAQPLRRQSHSVKAWFTRFRDWEDTSVEISAHSDQSCALTTYLCFVYIIFYTGTYTFYISEYRLDYQTRTHFSNTQNHFRPNDNINFQSNRQIDNHEQPRRHWFRLLS